MAVRKKKKYRLVFRRSHPVIWACILITVAISTVALITLRASIDASDAQYEDLRQQAAVLEADNDQLEDRISILGSVESAIQIAMEKLGLVLPDTVIFDPGQD